MISSHVVLGVHNVRTSQVPRTLALTALIITAHAFQIARTADHPSWSRNLGRMENVREIKGPFLQSGYNATINSQVCPSDVTGERTAQEDDSVRDLFNTTDSAKWDPRNLQKSLLDLLPRGTAGNPPIRGRHLTEHLFDFRCKDHAGGNGIYRHARRAERFGQRQAQIVNCSFAR